MDYIKIGDIFTEELFERGNLQNSKSLGVLYNLRRRPDLDATSLGVINAGATDTSDVFEVVAIGSEVLPELDLISAGVVKDHFLVQKFGRARNLPINQWANVWDGNNMYPYRSTNMVSPTVQSASALDTQTIKIFGVDQDFNLVETTVTLNGTTPVPVPISLMIPFRMFNTSNTPVTGNISLIDGGVTYAYILDGGDIYEQTQMAIMVVPSGYVGIVKRIGASISTGKSGQISYRAKPFGGVFRTARVYDLTNEITEDMEYAFAERTILDVVTKPDSNSTNVSAWFDVILIKKETFDGLYGEFGKYRLGV